MAADGARPPPITSVAPFLKALCDRGFSGDIVEDSASLSVWATDNSIYEVRPAAVLLPRTAQDVELALSVAVDPTVGPVSVTARGGGTGTNGQSLTPGVVVDLSRHMNRILEIDPVRRLAVVEPGVVLDQLNAAAADHDLFFPPNVSTASRATIGGMAATDASGKGSRLYGRTSDHIDAMDVVFAGGERATVRALSHGETRERRQGAKAVDRLLDQVLDEIDACGNEIERIFPRMNRGLTGYNLQAVRRPDGGSSLIPLLCGSEGTLAVTTRIVVRLTPRPAHRALAVVRYRDFDGALRDIARLLSAEPSAIEVIDDRILALAQGDIVWTAVEQALGSADGVAGLSFVEILADDAPTLQARMAGLRTLIATDAPTTQIDCQTVEDPALIAQLWNLRAKAVGLLGRMEGRRKGQAFVEDCAVPPERLADFVAEFRTLLDAHGLTYGMFGHADVGCLHVRPALDMADPADAALIRPISDAVAALTRKYGGLIWGEHGRGFRGEFSPAVFGPVLYPVLQRIKAAFDPLNILNPGKLAAPAGGSITAIDTPRMRGDRDRGISPAARSGFEKALTCNGNAACFNWEPADPMCPSWKATRDRRQSPKGRAALLRDWMASTDAPAVEREAIETALDATLATCLSCKACSSQCPVQVDIPTMKARYLHRRHRDRPRSLRDGLLARFETLLPLARALPSLANTLLRTTPVRRLLANRFGLVDLPAIRPSSLEGEPFDARTIAALSPQQHERAVILVADGFNATFDGATLAAATRLLQRLDYKVFVAPPTANGKALHVRGMLDRFARVAAKARQRQGALVATGLPVIGVEAVTNLMFRHEYRDDAATPDAPLALEEFLAAELAGGRLNLPPAQATAIISILLHCTERTARPQAAAEWRTVFQAFGLEVETPAVGCCGMAGLFGHEIEHQDLSRALFDMSWRAPLDAPDRITAATGFSCRCQASRFSGARPSHPAEILLAALA